MEYMAAILAKINIVKPFQKWLSHWLEMREVREREKKAAEGKMAAMAIKKKAYVSIAGMDDAMAGRMAFIEQLPANLLMEVFIDGANAQIRNFEAVFQKGQEQSNHGEEFGEKLGDRFSDEDSVAMRVVNASRYATTEELRTLLGKILAADVDGRGVIHPSTIETANRMARDELLSFLKLRAVAWEDANHAGGVVFLVVPGDITNGEKTIEVDERDRLQFKAFGRVSYSEFSRLEELGLVRHTGEILGKPLQKGAVEYDEEGEVVNCTTLAARNGNRAVIIGVVKSDRLPTGRISLTTEGEEILRLYMDESYETDEHYFTQVCEYWKRHGFLIHTIGGTNGNPK